MAGNPVFLIDNVYNQRRYPGHVVSATEEPTGTEAWRVADGRRHGLSKWTTTSTNTDMYVIVTCTSTCTCDFVALDRGHNLATERVVVEGSVDGTNYTNVATAVIPATTATFDVDDADGGLTEEGAFLKRFTEAEYSWWRTKVNNMGVGLIPEIVGLWLGDSIEMRPFDFPWTDDEHMLFGPVTTTQWGWEGVGDVVARRQGTIGLRCRDSTDFANMKTHIVEQFGRRRRPMWIVPDQAQADRAVLAVRDMNGVWGTQFDGRWPERRVSFGWIEHEPKRD